MKILFSEIKKLVPDLKADVSKVGNFLTMAGFMMESLEEVRYLGKKDWLMGLEVRHNRPDCLSVLGIAREVAAKWNKPLVLPEFRIKQKIGRAKNISVKNGRFVKRIIAYRVTHVENGPSPEWLRNFLALYGMNSKSLLVDLSNFVMIVTGYPSHLLDERKLEGDLVWDLNDKFSRITTLDGTEIKLKKKNEIILRDNKKILALAGLVGGKKAEIDEKTETIIAEMAVYDSGAVHKNASSLKIITEAGNRLSKHLDPNGLPLAINWLLALILEQAGSDQSQVEVFNYYPKKENAPKIIFNPEKSKKFAGIPISVSENQKILLSLGFKIRPIKNSGNWRIEPPIGRLDIQQEEDLIEEVIRFKGFEKIPFNEIPKLTVTKDITPKIVRLVDSARESLKTLGLDEILSCALVSKEANRQMACIEGEPVLTLNSVNEEFPELRVSLAPGLLNQLKEWRKKNLKFCRFFEIGKIFCKVKGKYLEHNSLALLWGDDEEKFSLNEMRKLTEKMLRSLGLSNLVYSPSSNKPQIANPTVCFDISVDDRPIGVLYKLLPEENRPAVYLSEINLNQVLRSLSHGTNEAVYEFKEKLVTLDVNRKLKKTESIHRLINNIVRKIGKKHLWNLEVKDAFPLKDGIKYTISVSYRELSDQKAKDLHAKVFGL